jgi:transcriptional regulator
MPEKRNDLLYGTLDFLVMRTLRVEPLHGYGIKQRLAQVTKGSLDINAGSLFPALYRLERQGFLKASWRDSETGRRAKYYSLTAAGKKKLGEETRMWQRAALAIARVVENT